MVSPLNYFFAPQHPQIIMHAAVLTEFTLSGVPQGVMRLGVGKLV